MLPYPLFSKPPVNANQCNGLGVTGEDTDLCGGRTIGCSLGMAGGCYGYNKATKTTGECDCKSGKFSHTEVNSLGGHVRGLPSGQSVHLSSKSSAQLGEEDASGGGIQTLVVSANGAFVFPLKYASGQLYSVKVIRNPTVSARVPECRRPSPRPLLHPAAA